MQLSIIIVNYNVKYFLEQALQAVFKAMDGIEAEVFVVDNNSSDDSVQMVREKFPEVILIANQDNPGFSIANNQAIRRSKGKYVLLLNPDTVVEEDTFKKCIDFMDSHPEAGALGVKMIDGSGKFLPESKRGFPSPFVAFCKTFGLSRLFPKSRLFNRYHLGYLPEDEVNEVDVLAGAFMFMRRKALDEVGLLDEAFFMYGEDIDLSYRITQGGYKNYYFPDTTIIHYKGESTKKGSLNYVKVFYNAMIIFAKKHFTGQRAALFVFMLQMAIYFRGFLTLVGNVFRKLALPLVDVTLIYVGLYLLKDIWANYRFDDPGYFKEEILYINFPLYVFIWVVTAFLSGAYDRPFSIGKLVRGILVGTLIIAAVYGFLNLEYRTSRALIILGAMWSLAATVSVRYLWHFYQYRNFKVSGRKVKNVIIVGQKEEHDRVVQLLHQAEVHPNIMGTIAPAGVPQNGDFIGSIDNLTEITGIYGIDEIIFCAKDVSSSVIMRWMTKLGAGIDYKIVPKESMSIIGSASKDTPGAFYTIEISYAVSAPAAKRNKRLFDFLLALFLVLTYPLQLFLVKNKIGLLKNIVAVLASRKSWVGYAPFQDEQYLLPKIKPGVLTPVSAIKTTTLPEDALKRLDFFYAKDYHVSRDWQIVWRAWRQLGNVKTPLPGYHNS